MRLILLPSARAKWLLRRRGRTFVVMGVIVDVTSARYSYWGWTRHEAAANRRGGFAGLVPAARRFAVRSRRGLGLVSVSSAVHQELTGRVQPAHVPHWGERPWLRSDPSERRGQNVDFEFWG